MSDGLGGTFVSGGYGDVHIVSLDGFAYDFQAVGEYVAARGNAGGTPWQVQIQTDGQHGTASWTIGLAAQFGDTAVIFEVGKPITLHVDGALRHRADAPCQPRLLGRHADGRVGRHLAGGLELRRGHHRQRARHLARLAGLGPRSGSVQGLLGPNSAPWSYLNLPDGTMQRQAWSNDQIVGAYADGWRVADSLFEHHHSPL